MYGVSSVASWCSDALRRPRSNSPAGGSMYITCDWGLILGMIDLTKGMRCSSFWGEDVNDDDEGLLSVVNNDDEGIKATLRSG